MALPVHVFAQALLRRRRAESRDRNYAAADTSARSLEGILSERTESVKGRIIRAKSRWIDCDVPMEAQAGLYYKLIVFSVKEASTKRIYQLLQPISRGYWKDEKKVYAGREVDLTYKALLFKSISSLHFVSNFIWPSWKSSTEPRVYPVRERIKADGIITGGLDLTLLDPY